MSTAQLVWVTSLIVALGLLPVGAFRMLIYRSGETDHTPTHRFVAWLALGLGSVALLVLLAVSLWSAATGGSPVPGDG